jgi:anti-anti-sigma factor
MKQRQVGSIFIVTPKGYLTGGKETDELEQAIKQLSEADARHLVINLAEAQHLNSTALGVLISAHSNFVRRGGQMKLRGQAHREHLRHHQAVPRIRRLCERGAGDRQFRREALSPAGETAQPMGGGSGPGEE